jgi:tRNA(Arg) A34 adenosine deaminase TadA
MGAALVVGGELWSTAHAEHQLIAEHSARLRATPRGQDAVPICLYTTLEPCLMCLGIAVLHKVNRIVVACPDPHGGATRLDPASLGDVYPRIWPEVVRGPGGGAACDLIINFLHTGRFASATLMLPAFQALRVELDA